MSAHGSSTSALPGHLVDSASRHRPARSPGLVTNLYTSTPSSSQPSRMLRPPCTPAHAASAGQAAPSAQPCAQVQGRRLAAAGRAPHQLHDLRGTGSLRPAAAGRPAPLAADGAGSRGQQTAMLPHPGHQAPEGGRIPLHKEDSSRQGQHSGHLEVDHACSRRACSMAVSGAATPPARSGARAAWRTWPLLQPARLLAAPGASCPLGTTCAGTLRPRSHHLSYSHLQTPSRASSSMCGIGHRRRYAACEAGSIGLGAPLCPEGHCRVTEPSESCQVLAVPSAMALPGRPARRRCATRTRSLILLGPCWARRANIQTSPCPSPSACP